MAPEKTPPIPENSGRHFRLVIIFAWRHSYTVASKILTREQAQSRKDAAVRFAENVLDDPDKADDIESEDLDDWIARKKITLIDNPKRRSLQMANGGNGQTKQDLLDQIADLQDENDALQSQLDAIADIIGPDDDDGDEDNGDDDPDSD